MSDPWKIKYDLLSEASWLPLYLLSLKREWHIKTPSVLASVGITDEPNVTIQVSGMDPNFIYSFKHIYWGNSSMYWKYNYI